MNEYQVQAAADVLALAERLPLTAKITYECRGIVGGDFDVVVKSTIKPHRGRVFETEVVNR